MKYLNKFIVYIILSIVVFCSCNKEEFLNPVPQTVISEANAFGSPERILGQVLSMYSSVKGGTFMGGRYFVYNDIRAEEFLNVTGNQVTGSNTWAHLLGAGTAEVNTLWAQAYNAVNRTNIVLEGLDANSTVISAALADQYRAEARFLRALTYFSLVTLYGEKPFNADNGASKGLPIRLEAETEASNSQLARSTVAQVYQQILGDLEFAEQKLPLTYTASTSTPDINVARAHRNSAIAVKTRVYLNMGRYNDVITEANKLVPSSAPFQTSSGVTHRLNTSFTDVFRTYLTAESIFSLPMTSTSGPGVQNGLAGYYTTEYELNPTGIIADANWKSADTRKTFIVTSGSKKWYNKFNSDNANYVPVIRYAEVMLNLAEALARTNAGVDARAVALLNAVRQRSDATTTFAPATKDELINLILNERRIEFLTEGLRSIDLLRTLQTIPAKTIVAAIPPSNHRYVFPIPENELLFNQLMIQNSGY